MLFQFYSCLILYTLFYEWCKKHSVSVKILLFVFCLENLMSIVIYITEIMNFFVIYDFLVCSLILNFFFREVGAGNIKSQYHVENIFYSFYNYELPRKYIFYYKQVKNPS